MAVAKCCWCGGSFVRVDGHFWCTTPACRERQAAHSVAVQMVPRKKAHWMKRGPEPEPTVKYLYVPVPRQVEFDACMARYLLGGGAAGSTKSHGARWNMYRRAIALPGYEGLILRETWDELNKHHFRLMDAEANVFQQHGINARFSITNREMTFYHANGIKSVIEGGHMENPEDVKKYLSRERDEIVADEGSLFPPRPLLELSTRARSTKPQILAAGFRGLFRVYTNPGGPASSTLRDFFIDHSPDWDQFPAKLREDYRPSEWVYIPGILEDNPYLDENYERDLAILSPWRYEQLRHNNWDIMAGQFFHEFKSSTHVKDLGDPGGDVEWFRSMDWGYINPGVCLWWACLPDGVLYIRKELKFSHTSIPEVSDQIREITKDLGIPRVRYTSADPSIFSQYGGSSSDKQEGETIAETFARPPCRVPLVKADNNRSSGWQRIRELLRLRPDGKPWLVIHPDCRYLIRTFAAATSAKHDPEDIGFEDDHALDAARYGGMSRPSPTRKSKVGSSKTFRAAQERVRQHQRQLTVR